MRPCGRRETHALTSEVERCGAAVSNWQVLYIERGLFTINFSHCNQVIIQCELKTVGSMPENGYRCSDVARTFEYELSGEKRRAPVAVGASAQLDRQVAQFNAGCLSASGGANLCGDRKGYQLDERRLEPLPASVPIAASSMFLIPVSTTYLLHGAFCGWKPRL